VATNDVLTPTEARTALGIGAGDAKYETLLPIWITAVSTKLDSLVGPVVYSTITGELHSGGASHLYLKKSPVASVVSVVEYDSIAAGTLTASTNVSQPTAGFLVDTTAGKIVRRDGNANRIFPYGLDNIYVTYVAGRYANTAAVEARFKAGAELMLKNLWRTFENSAQNVNEFDVPRQNFPRFAVPNAVKDLLADEWRSVGF